MAIPFTAHLSTPAPNPAQLSCAAPATPALADVDAVRHGSVLVLAAVPAGAAPWQVAPARTARPERANSRQAVPPLRL